MSSTLVLAALCHHLHATFPQFALANYGLGGPRSITFDHVLEGFQAVRPSAFEWFQTGLG